MSSTWIPRAATSVATKTAESWSLIRARVRVRTAWDLPPCSVPTVTPAFERLSANLSAPRLVRTKKIDLPSREAIWLEISPL